MVVEAPAICKQLPESFRISCFSKVLSRSSQDLLLAENAEKFTFRPKKSRRLPLLQRSYIEGGFRFNLNFDAQGSEAALPLALLERTKRPITTEPTRSFSIKSG